MEKSCWERAIESKYSLLLGSLVLLIATSPLLTADQFVGFLVQSLLFLMMILAMLRILGARRTVFVISGVCAALAIFFHYLTLLRPDDPIAGALSSLSYTTGIGIALLFMLKSVFSEKSVTGDTVKGGISLYILFGLWWETLYSAMWSFNHGSFTQGGHGPGIPDFFYFSFTTLTTLGYGDIVPVSQGAKTAAMLEAMVGQIYLAVFVARLVGLHVAGSRRGP